MSPNRLSYSAITTYEECSMKYYLHYIQKLRPIATKSAFVFGNALDGAFNSLLKERNLEKALRVFRYRMNNIIVNGKRVKVKNSEFVTYTKNDLDEEFVRFCANRDELPYTLNGYTSLLLKGDMMVRAYFHEVLPKIKEVISIQKRISLKNDDGDSISGTLDAIITWEDGKTYIVDNKSSTVKYTDDSVRESNQLALYHYVEKNNTKLDGAMFIVLDKNINKNKKKECTSCQIINTSSHKTCPEMILFEDGAGNSKHIRCNGEFFVTINPSVDIDYKFGKIEPEDEERVLEVFDRVNQCITDGIFECKGKACYTKFGKCIYQDYCLNGSMEGLVQLDKK